MTLVSVSLALGMYLFAYRPALAPPASKPPGLKTRAASLGPNCPNEGICLTPLLNSPAYPYPTLERSTLDGSENTLGKPINVYATTVSLVMVGLNTWVSVPDTESERFLPSIGVGYGTWSVLRHHRPT